MGYGASAFLENQGRHFQGGHSQGAGGFSNAAGAYEQGAGGLGPVGSESGSRYGMGGMQQASSFASIATCTG